MSSDLLVLKMANKGKKIANIATDSDEGKPSTTGIIPEKEKNTHQSESFFVRFATKHLNTNVR